MSLRIGLAEADITPKLGTRKVGWLSPDLYAREILDPLFAKAMVIESGGTRIGFVSLDILSIRWTQVCQIRALAEKLGIPSGNLMVAATHNHAGPATVSSLGPQRHDAEYVALMVERAGQAIEKAMASLAPARLAVASGFEGRISFIRRYFMKDGSVKTHPGVASPQMRCAEGVIDPELGVLCVKDLQDRVRGVLVNFACHPTHHGGDNCITAGYPGQVAMALKHALGKDCVTLFLNGAFGNVHHGNPIDPDYVDDMRRMGEVLATDVQKLMPSMQFVVDCTLGGKTATLELPYRDIEGPHGLKHRTRQPFADEKIYAEAVEQLRAKKAVKGHALAEVQCLTIGSDAAFVSIPAEYFVDLGLRIKMASRVPNTYLVGAANGMVGYVPTRDAFDRGGYETTLSMWSKLAPESGDLLADAALDLLGRKS